MQSILTLNAGSSSIRFAIHEAGDPPQGRLSGKVDRIGKSGTSLVAKGAEGTSWDPLGIEAPDRGEVVDHLLNWLESVPGFDAITAVGHRVVHGMTHGESTRVTPALIEELHSFTPYAPEHLPLAIELMQAVGQRHSALPQVACFDTAFHRDMPRIARLLPIPRRYEAAGVRRYGFHGLSYAFLIEELARLGVASATRGRVILAHLGNGASLCAVRDGRSIDTSMGFTPTSGLVMGTRTGDLDPGLVSFLARRENMTAAQFEDMVNQQSGLLGVSETSADLRDLLAREDEDVRAAEAIELFCYQAKKWIGAFAAALGGVDTLVFSGGAGESAPRIRAGICEGLGFLGIELDRKHNDRHAPVISARTSHVEVRVIHTDEELMIARSTLRVLNNGSSQGQSS